jgi:hypothetical protein
MTNYLIINDVLYDLEPIVHFNNKSSLSVKVSLWNRIRFLFRADMQFIVEYRTPLKKRRQK